MTVRRAVYTRVERLEPGSAESVAHLREHGFVVVAKALSDSEAATCVSATWDYLEGLGTGISRSDVGTWGDERWPFSVEGGIVPALGVGQSTPQWLVRGAPKVKRAFVAVWGTEDLLVSFDGMALWRPWQLEPRWRTTAGESWLHIDQHPITRPGFCCVQGLVNLLPMSEATGGNAIIPGSHRDFEQLPAKYEERIAKLPASLDHFRYPTRDPLLAATANRAPIVAHLEVGDLLLWDSRTIHCSAASEKAPT
eukprot:COSAG06_NODE_18195_length_899_cov_0.996250_1_plen_251_part_10